jgi:DNA-binding NarL/FixJ family response regulator
MDGAPHRVASASVAAHVGFFDDATAEAEELLRISQATGVVATQARALGVLGHVALQNGDYDTAIDRLEQAVGLVLALGGGLPMLLPAALDLAEAAFRAGEVERMGRVALVVLDAPAPRSPWAEAMRARARAFSLEAEGERERAAEAAATSLALAREHPVPFERARAALLVGLFLRRGRRWREARDALGEALETFDEVGAAGWAELAASELARIPGRSRGGAELTETERRVAELVAQGLSNKEVAGRLFVTVRTVEANLTKVYAKLGIRSRTELAGRLHP